MVINTASETLYKKVKMQAAKGFANAEFKNLPAGTCRLDTLAQNLKGSYGIQRRSFLKSLDGAGRVGVALIMRCVPTSKLS